MRKYKFTSEWFVDAMSEDDAFDKFLNDYFEFASDAKIKEVCPICLIEAGQGHQLEQE